MDEIGVSQQYYIATRSSPADDRTRVLKYGSLFAVFDRYGDIEPLGMGEQGIFAHGTRFLSEMVLYLWNSRPLLLSSTIKDDNLLLTVDLANVDVYYEDEVVIPRDTLHLMRSKFLWKNACFEEFKLVNYGLSPIVIPFRLAIGADFADIFEVRGTRRERRGRRVDDEVSGEHVTYGYEGLDGRLRQTRLYCDPPPQQISSSELGYCVSLRPKEEARLHLTISCDVDSRGRAVSFGEARSHSLAEFQRVRVNRSRIRSTNDRLSRWIKRSAADVEMMTVGNDEVGYPYAGVPWFSTVFGRDGIITALEMLWLDPSIARGVLEFLAATQATEINAEIEAQPGKILHEMRHGEMAATGEVPFGRYYGSVDATPLFIMLAAAYFQRTADLEFVRGLWPHIQMALGWIDTYGDLDGDGFLEYARHSSKGLVQQGWKDSNDSIFHSDGTLADAPIALCEVQGYVYAAKLAIAELAQLLGDERCATKLKSEASRLRSRFEEAFWCAELGTYAIALDGRKRACQVRASNAGHCLYSGIANYDKASLVAKTLLSPAFFTGWGVRTVACGEARYNPLSYHNGSVWPHDNAIIAAGLAKYGFKDLAGQILLSHLDVSSVVELHRLPELFCGLDRRQGEGPTLYPVACSPQAWAAGAAFMMLQACLGLSIDCVRKRIVLDRPYLPEGIRQLRIGPLSIGDGTVKLHMERGANTVQVHLVEKQGEVEVVLK
ncbi:MAG TPA: amylo-alpha-1,6-glucosidase [Terriglobales bacterium]